MPCPPPGSGARQRSESGKAVSFNLINARRGDGNQELLSPPTGKPAGSNQLPFEYLGAQCGRFPLSGSQWARSEAIEWPTCNQRLANPSDDHLALLARRADECETPTAGGQWKYLHQDCFEGREDTARGERGSPC
eukprot:1429331-Amphidinium_carterae.1